MRIESSLPPVEYDGRAIGIVLGVALVIALSPLRGMPDPLADTVFTYRGMNSAWTPIAIALMCGWMLLKRLRRLRFRKYRVRRRSLSFLAGISICLIPAVFYLSTKPLWTNSAPLSALFLRGFIGGFLLGAIASWYVPASMWARSPE
jgi:hypothetical protein